jgi:hypothetical protein
MNTHAAIPTRYAGVQFRSRLEARWAAFFDLVGWCWEYEPIELDGYIPDFILKFSIPLLVEVKPIVRWPCNVPDCLCAGDISRGTFDAAIQKIVDAWDGSWVLLGACLKGLGQTGSPSIGSAECRWQREDRRLAEDLMLFECSTSGLFGLRSNTRACWPDGTPAPMLCGKGCETSHGMCQCGGLARPASTTSIWREAGNRVQWRPPR